MLLQCCASLSLPEPIWAFARPLEKLQAALQAAWPAFCAQDWPNSPASACPTTAIVSLQAYYGLSLAMNDLAGSVYLNQFLGFVVEFPAYLLVILVIDRLGRRFAISWSMLIGEGAAMCRLGSLAGNLTINYGSS